MEKKDEFLAIDTVFADFIMRRCGGKCPESLLRGAMLAVRAVRNGESCADMTAFAGREVRHGEDIWSIPDIETLRKEYSAPECRCVLAFYDGNGEIPPVPLIMDSGNRLYLQRYMVFEKMVAGELLSRMGEMPDSLLPPGELAGLSDFFASRAGGETIDNQQLAVFAAYSGRFTVISGGPGTGKTTVVAALLALELKRREDLRIMLCAPTGKAQARLQESLLDGIGKLKVTDCIREKIAKLSCSTIHSMLKPEKQGNEFRFNRRNTLPCDLLVVDECSMVSLPLMARLLSALPAEARVVMLGDKDQLASVEAGAVMADICQSGTSNAFSAGISEIFFRQTGWRTGVADGSNPLDGAIAELTENHRFASAPSIGEVSSRIRSLQTEEECDALGDEIAEYSRKDFLARKLNSGDFAAALKELAGRRIYQGYALKDLPELAKQGGAENLNTAFALLQNFRILAAIRKGRYGVEALNGIMRRILGLEDMYQPGVPLMVTANDWGRELFNGDIGLVWRMSRNEPAKVFFPGRARGFLPSELPEHETVFAMTVHKSQGSGFANVLLILPEEGTPVLTRELFYTAVTRAAEYVEIWGGAGVIKYALRNKTVRTSGLAERLLLLKKEREIFK